MIERRLWLVGLLAVVACTASPSDSLRSPSSSDAAASPAAGGFEACGPVDLRSPNGETVDLNGEWGGGEWFSTPGSGERTFVQQVGDCVWMSISDDQFRAGPKPNESLLAVYVGKVHPDFSVSGDLVTLLRYVDPFTYGAQSVATEVRLRIEFDANGQILLAEDRVQGVVGPRCPNAEFWCPAPTVLRQVITEPSPSPT